MATVDYAFIFLLFAFFVGSVLKFAAWYVPKFLRLPYTVSVLLAGGIFDRILSSTSGDFASAFDEFEGTDPHVILFVMLPPLLYESAANVDWHVFKKILFQALLLAGPGVIIGMTLTGVFVRYAFWGYEENWGWNEALLLASIMSATDPVAVVASLQELKAPARLSSVIEGESLLNDGTALVIFLIFESRVEGHVKDAAGVTKFFCQLSMGGPLFGLLCAFLTYCWIRLGRGTDQLFEVTVIIVAFYGTFYLAEAVLHVSGVLAVVVLGLFMAAKGNLALCHKVQHSLHAVVAQLSHLSTIAIFFISGVVVAAALTTVGEAKDWLYLFMLYIFLHIVRAAIILVMFPILHWTGYRMNWKEATMLWFGGLRGAVGLALALMIDLNEDIHEDVRNRVLFHTCGIVLLTILINGTLADKLYKALDIYPVNHCHARVVMRSLKHFEKEFAQSVVEQWETHWFYRNADWKRILRVIPNFVVDTYITSSNTINVDKKHLSHFWRKKNDKFLNPNYHLESGPCEVVNKWVHAVHAHQTVEEAAGENTYLTPGTEEVLQRWGTKRLFEDYDREIKNQEKEKLEALAHQPASLRSLRRGMTILNVNGGSSIRSHVDVMSNQSRHSVHSNASNISKIASAMVDAHVAGQVKHITGCCHRRSIKNASLQDQFVDEVNTQLDSFTTMLNAVGNSYMELNHKGFLHAKALLLLKESVARAQDHIILKGHEARQKARKEAQSATNAGRDSGTSTSDHGTAVHCLRVEFDYIQNHLRENRVQGCLMKLPWPFSIIFDHATFESVMYQCEVLLGFIEAHTRAAKNLDWSKIQGMEDVGDKLRNHVIKANGELLALSETYPRHFRTAQSLYTIKVLLHRKARMLEEYAEEGVMHETDVEILLDALHHTKDAVNDRVTPWHWILHPGRKDKFDNPKDEDDDKPKNKVDEHDAETHKEEEEEITVEQEQASQKQGPSPIACGGWFFPRRHAPNDEKGANAQAELQLGIATNNVEMDRVDESGVELTKPKPRKAKR